MSNAFTRQLSTPPTQREQALPNQVENNAGGFVFTVDDKTRLTRFLIIGTDGGTYYANEKKLTKDSIQFLIELIQRDEQLVIDTVREISTDGRAYRNSPAIFAVAALFTYGKLKPATLVTDVCRTGTHIFEFAEYVQLLGGWGRAKRAAVANWYTSKSLDSLAMQVVKYRQRNGWTHKDMLRLAHPVGLNTDIGNFVLDKELSHTSHRTIIAFKAAQQIGVHGVTLRNVMLEYPNLPWEAYPTDIHKNVDFWKTLFYNGSLRGQALLRNITRLAKLDAFVDLVFAADYAEKLLDVEMIKSTRLHPIQYLLALMVHTEGQLERPSAYRRNKNWNTSGIIKDALNEGFYLAFNYVEPANKRTFLGIDVSGSMTVAYANIDLTAAQLAAAMAMVTARTEPYYMAYGFSDGGRGWHAPGALRDLNISKTTSLEAVLRTTANMSFGATDCAGPMLYAAQNNIEIDTFVVYTDNETWFGNVHPYKALQQYRQKTGIPAKLAVVAITPTEFSIANPQDSGMLDVSGGDANLPKLLTEFSAGRL